MKKVIICLAAISFSLSAAAQGETIPDGGHHERIQSLWELATKQEKKNDAFNLYLNFSGSFRETINPFTSAFQAKHLSLEIQGAFGKHLSYQFRHRLNRPWWTEGQEDNFAKATEIAMVGWKFNEHLAINMGKMRQIWGGFEFNENPLYIYQYSEFLENMEFYGTGLMLSWHPAPSHELAVMVTNNFTSQPQYKGFEKSDHPFTYILNWNGRMFGGKFNTRWAAGAQTMAKGQYSFIATAGQQLALRRFQFYVDYMGEYDQIDRLGIVSGELGFNTGILYHTFVAKANWQFAPQWNLMGKGMYEVASVHNNEFLMNYHLTIGWAASVEFFPWKGQDLRFFLNYVGRDLHYTQASGLAGKNGINHRVELGFIYRIKAY
jgi:hypothetical protein